MATGFIYVVRAVDRNYRQFPGAVPTWHEDRLYFGPSKSAMRPRMQEGDYVFGISPSTTSPRRIVFAARIAEKVTYREAYERWPALHGPDGPIHVQPMKRHGLRFPRCEYEHIPGALNPVAWKKDLRTPAHDAFFAFEPEGNHIGRWFGADGPVVDGEILAFIQACAVFGHTGPLDARNPSATADTPIRHGHLYTGLHLQTDAPLALVELCRRARLSAAFGTVIEPADGVREEDREPLPAMRRADYAVADRYS